MSSTEILQIQNPDTFPTSRDRVVTSLRRKALDQSGIISIEQVDTVIEAVRRLGFEHVTIPSEST